MDRQDRGAILLTGVTGFVGGELLRRLITRDERTILCLIRGDSEAQARQRGHERLRELLGRTPRIWDETRVRFIRADLEAPDLGLPPLAWTRLAGRVREIFHCAASVEFDLPLERAYRINVEGVRQLVSLACGAGTRFRRFHHVSTAYVSGVGGGRVDANHLPPDRASCFRNSYEHSKARAERFLREQSRIPVTIYRPSIIAGDTETGRTDNWNVLYVPMRQILAGRLPILRRGRPAIVDTVGVDFVVDGMLALAEREGPRIQAYHLTAGRLAFDVDAYLAVCNAAAQAAGHRKRTRAVGPLAWAFISRGVRLLARAPESWGGLRRKGLAARSALRCFEPYLAYTGIALEFACEREHALLAEAGVEMPPPDVYLRRIVDYAQQSDFGRRACRGAARRTIARPVRRVFRPGGRSFGGARTKTAPA